MQRHAGSDDCGFLFRTSSAVAVKIADHADESAEPAANAAGFAHASGMQDVVAAVAPAEDSRRSRHAASGHSTEVLAAPLMHHPERLDENIHATVKSQAK